MTWPILKHILYRGNRTSNINTACLYYVYPMNAWVLCAFLKRIPDGKVRGANVGPTWVLSAPDGPHVGSMNLAIRGNNCTTDKASERVNKNIVGGVLMSVLWERGLGKMIKIQRMVAEIFRSVQNPSPPRLTMLTRTKELSFMNTFVNISKYGETEIMKE